jgi:hypothetical protein
MDPVAERVERLMARYKAKTAPGRVAALFEAQGQSMRDNYRIQAEVMQKVEQAVADVTDAAGAPVMMRFWYKDYGREVYRIWRAVPTSCQEGEYEVVRYKWTVRGLNPELMDKVKAAVLALLEKSDFPRKDDARLT